MHGVSLERLPSASWFHGLLWRNQIFGSYDLPIAIASYPRVCPNKASSQRLAAASFPRLATLCDGSIAVKSDFDLICAIADKIFGRLASVGNRRGLVVEVSNRVHTDEIIGQNAFKCGGVTGGNRLRQLALTLDNVTLDITMVALTRAG